MIQIEDLEGYKRVKDVYVAQLKLGLSPYDYEEAMLQYRREHNIFEFGDKVVIVINALDNGSIWKVIGSDSCMVEISQVGKQNEWVHYSEIAHYIPEEVEGRELGSRK